MKNVEINNNTYCLEENYKDSFDLEEITSMILITSLEIVHIQNGVWKGFMRVQTRK